MVGWVISKIVNLRVMHAPLLLGAIVTRLSAIEDMAGMAILCSDKTGTLTQNKMELQAECPVYHKV